MAVFGRGIEITECRTFVFRMNGHLQTVETTLRFRSQESLIDLEREELP
jgi:hypothetical protein